MVSKTLLVALAGLGLVSASPVRTNQDGLTPDQIKAGCSLNMSPPYRPECHAAAGKYSAHAGAVPDAYAGVDFGCELTEHILPCCHLSVLGHTVSLGCKNHGPEDQTLPFKNTTTTPLPSGDPTTPLPSQLPSSNDSGNQTTFVVPFTGETTTAQTATTNTGTGATTASSSSWYFIPDSTMSESQPTASSSRPGTGPPSSSSVTSDGQTKNHSTAQTLPTKTSTRQTTSPSSSLGSTSTPTPVPVTPGPEVPPGRPTPTNLPPGTESGTNDDKELEIPTTTLHGKIWCLFLDRYIVPCPSGTSNMGPVKTWMDTWATSYNVAGPSIFRRGTEQGTKTDKETPSSTRTLEPAPPGTGGYLYDGEESHHPKL